MERKFVARVTILERHADGSARQFSATRIVSTSTTVGELFQWRDKTVHDPLNGEFAAPEIILTPDGAALDND
ncbi:MAG: hypothetical protein N2111_02915 [Candidatus Sumerlaeaceae bacterium]|nr:hypothetical protein [Candidatus Sumerlaeaceae bacterium]